MRIRSIHPEQWQDGDFCSMTPMTRLLVLGIRNMADDYGVFPWRVDHIKAAIFPHDQISLDDVDGFLKEAAAFNQVKYYEVDDTSYGIIRNFCKYQSPRKPTAKHPKPINDLGRGYRMEGLVTKEYGTSAELVPNQCGTSTVPLRHGEGEGKGDGDGKGYVNEEEELPPSPLAGGAESELHNTEHYTEAEQAVMDKWNEMAGKNGLSKVTRLNSKRKTALRERRKDPWWREHWVEALEKISASPFLLGTKPGSDWKAHLEWFLRPDTVAKLVEGGYGQRDMTGQYAGQDEIPF
jgi:hypothetical protein